MRAPSPTRRGLLGMMAAVPAVAALPATAASSSDTAYHVALRRYVQAHTDMLAYQAGPYKAASDRFSAIRNRWPICFNWQHDPEASAAIKAALRDHKPVEAEFNRLVMAANGAWREMLATPSPDIAAAHHKLAVLVSEEAWEFEDCADIFQAMLADLERLTGGLS